jgi:DNA repair protein RecO (recombination protein O)
VSTAAPEKLRAIVLRKIPYSDNSSILRCFTDLHGLQGFMVRGGPSKRSVIKPVMLLPLTELELVVQLPKSGGLGRIRDAQLTRPSPGVVGPGWEGALAGFAAELLNAMIKEDARQEDLFAQLMRQLDLLHQPASPRDLTFFPLYFLLDLMRHFGFLPSVGMGVYFDLLEGRFTDQMPDHAYLLAGQEVHQFQQLLQAFANSEHPDLPRAVRAVLLDRLLLFCKLHHEPRLQIRSVAVIRDLM